MNIDKIFEMMDWNQPLKVQKKGIKKASKVKHLSVFFQPVERQCIWNNCAKVIASKKNEELDLYLFKMFEWLKDMNWPGASIIFNRLLDIPATLLLNTYEMSLAQAQLMEDFAWKSALRDFWEKVK